MVKLKIEDKFNKKVFCTNRKRAPAVRSLCKCVIFQLFKAFSTVACLIIVTNSMLSVVKQS